MINRRMTITKEEAEKMLEQLPSSKVVRVPFCGFYYSQFQDDLEMMVEYFDYDYEQVDWKATHQHAAEEYVKEWLLQAGLWGEFDSLVSPREYNFSTDALYVKFAPAALLEIKTDVMRDRHGEFTGWVYDNCKSRDGFISFLPHTLSEWPEEWEEKHYYAALLFLEEEYNLEESVLEAIRANGHVEILTL